MEYPVIIDGRRAGVLYTRKSGVMTEFYCALNIAERLIRLWLIGEGAYCLGVMEPKDGKMCLCRRLSRREMQRLPDNISYVSDGPAKGAVHAEPAPEEADGERTWYEDAMGVLSCQTERGLAVAIPAELEKGSAGYERLVTINGKKYLLFL